MIQDLQITGKRIEALKKQQRAEEKLNENLKRQAQELGFMNGTKQNSAFGMGVMGHGD
jgi:hypothetical protein